MYHKVLTSPKFYLLLYDMDEALAEKAHDKPCVFCGGGLDWANYPRKPRGGPPKTDDKVTLCFSLCCGQKSCRRRNRLPSLRFLGRKVYFGVIVTLITAMAHGVSSSRAASLRSAVGVSRQTLTRWRDWWLGYFPATSFWQEVRGRFATQPDLRVLPKSLLEPFSAAHEDPQTAVSKLLLFLSPLTGRAAEN